MTQTRRPYRAAPHLRVVRDDRLPLAPEILPRVSWLLRGLAVVLGLAIAMLAFGACLALATVLGGGR